MVRAKQVEKAVELLKGKRILVVTGAGMSTDSGIPDYRGKGMLSKNPLIAHKYEHDPLYRKRFWIRVIREWAPWLNVEPNAGHEAIAKMEYDGHISGVVTQNVDGLHALSGSINVSTIHGDMFTSSCMLCGEIYDQEQVIEKTIANNPKIITAKRVVAKTFLEPMCTECGGFLKPDVVFFGDMLPETEWLLAEEIAKESDAVLIAGTSLIVGTPHWFIDMVRKKKGPIVVVNKGKTLMDDVADLKISDELSLILPMIAEGLNAHVSSDGLSKV